MTFLALVLAALSAASLFLGYETISLQTMREALGNYDSTLVEHVVFMEIRLPRMVGALIGGAALGAAGALLQGMTRNPLADPGILGVNAGAAVGVVISIMILRITDPAQYVWAAMASCILISGVVFLIGGLQNANPVRLLIAGAAVAAVCFALIRAVLLLSRQTLDTYRFWVLGGLDGVSFSTISALAPFLAAGAVLALISSVWLNALTLGQDAARGLGLRVGLTQLVTAAAVLLLCGGTVSMIGPVAFVGLVGALIARSFAGGDTRLLLLLAAPIGAALLLTADMLGRTPLFGGAMQAGVMSAIIGGPLLTLLIWRRGVGRA